MKNLNILFVSLFFGLTACVNAQTVKHKDEHKMDTNKVVKTEEEWKQILSPMQYKVVREKGTERAFTGEYTDHFEKGYYECVACGEKLFESSTKYHSGCGWPSFYNKTKKNNIIEKIDRSHGMVRTEVLCARCDAHLGHVFNDGPEPTGLRYCINSLSLKFVPYSSEEKDQANQD